MTTGTVPLGELADSFVDGPFGSDLQVSEYVPAGIAIARIQNVRRNFFNGENLRFITEAKAKRLQRHDYQAGDLLITKLGEPCGLACIVPETVETGIIVADVTRFRGKYGRVDLKYLSHFLNSPTGQREVTRRAKGTTRQRINLTSLKEIPIPLPSLQEQQRIAAILDKADALRRKGKRTIELLDSLTQSIFLQMFGDPGTNPNGFQRGVIGELLEDTQYGTSAKAGEAGAFPILRMGNVTNDGRIVVDDLKFIDLSDKEIEKYTVRKGDILFNRTNSVDLVGKTAVFGIEEPFAFAGYLVRARTKNSISPHYVAGYLNSRHGKATLRNMAKSIVGMANINAKEMASISILIPDADSQDRYTTALTSVGKQRMRLEKQLRDISSLFSSLQSRAFSGQL
ncbi:restriction endonuclease subunit S [Mesorhizobium sp.]|uniref:restriction endonuclease subunit S n=1 Tax=Mesorhizobium sp. TaxID=1871066 RepID=UPI00257A4261|nr:restriction endonuclease subunit S [Mesorhizobium sp.]